MGCGEKGLTQEVHVRVSSRLQEQLDRLAADLKMSRSDVLREVIEKGLPAIVEQHRSGRSSDDSSGRE